MDLHNYLELSGVKCADDRYVKQRRTPISAGTWMGSRSAIFVFSFHVSWSIWSISVLYLIFLFLKIDSW